MFRFLLLCIISMLALTACEQQKQASVEVGAIPKTIIDKATNDLNNAQALAAEKIKAADNGDAPADVVK